MRTTTLAAVFIIVFPAPLLLAWQDQARKAELINQLQTAYPLTVMDGIKVLKPGTLLVIQQDGIQANPMKLGPSRIDTKKRTSHRRGVRSPEEVRSYGRTHPS